MVDPPGLRVSDEDRDRVASEIREHFAQGRLDSEELGDRLGRAYSARTSGELEAVRSDLPALPVDAASRRREELARRPELTRQLLQQTGAAFAPFLICTLLWILGGADSDFWPAWLLLVPAIALVRNGWRLFGPAPELDRVAEELAEQRRRLPPGH